MTERAATGAQPDRSGHGMPLGEAPSKQAGSQGGDPRPSEGDGSRRLRALPSPPSAGPQPAASAAPPERPPEDECPPLVSGAGSDPTKARPTQEVGSQPVAVAAEAAPAPTRALPAVAERSTAAQPVGPARSSATHVEGNADGERDELDERESSKRFARQLTVQPAEAQHEVEPAGRRLALLMLTALGVVYGDIGTSPLYAIRECLQPAHGVPVTEPNVLGVLSLIFWSLLVVISTKYLLLVMRADNRGEGGILALMSLLHTGALPRAWRTRAIVLMGLFGAALLYGDGTITPAISVLSAIEGLEVATPVFEPYVIPITCVILVGLFAFQRRGTAGVGILFGPVTLVWFLVLAVLGVSGIASAPRVLWALSPTHGAGFLLHNGWHGFLVVGAVFLVVTGGEALYADMGHFGRRPIRLAWFGLVLPALLLNYFGQGALLLNEPLKISNPFYLLAPTWGLYPLVILSTAATVIASQAVISGAFSLSRQAIQLGYLPRMGVEHTSAEEIGQIYVPAINWALLVATLALVVGFRRSTNLAAAYGVAVTTTMVITTGLIFLLARRQWGWSLPLASTVFGAFLVVDLTFFASNIIKVPDGGWFPLAVGVGVYLLFSTWKRGRELLGARLAEQSTTLTDVLAWIEEEPPTRIPGKAAVFMTSSADGAPPVLVHHLRHNRVLQERVLLLTVVTREVPYVAQGDRIRLEELGQGFSRVLADFGFMETPTVSRILRQCRTQGLEVRKRDITYYLGRETLVVTKRPGLAIWRERLFAFMSRNAQRATYYFRIPPEQVFEIGVQVEL